VADAAAQKVFICYRREETAAHAGRLYDAMVARFGERNVFMDVDMAPGVDFVERITKVVSGCLVLIVVMGPHWATVTDEHGKARITDPEDFVRLEVETGLQRSDVTPIPVLVSGAQMPRPEDLPPELQPITRRNALDLSDARWRYDVGRLNGTLDELLADIAKSDGEVATPPTPAPGPSATRLLLEGMLVAGVTAYLARWLAEALPQRNGPAGEIAGVVLRRGETWALVGAALAVWLATRTGRTDLFRAAVAGLIVGALAGAIGGAIWAVPVFLPDPYLTETDLAQANRIQIGSLAVTGALLGALIGTQWRPARLGVGLLGGLIAAAVIQLFLNAIGLEGPATSEIALSFAIAAIAIAGLSLAALTARGTHGARDEGRMAD
jgi:TIR domain